MNAPARTALKAASAGLALLLGAAAAAATDDLREELERCAQLRNAEVRLACYDALAGISAARPRQASSAGEAPASSGSAPAAATSAPEQAAQPESAQSLPDRTFGLLPTGGQAGKIESRVVGKVDGLEQGTRFELENGQIWRQADRTHRNYRATSPRVEIREGFMNSYRMRLEGLNARIRVRRVK